LYGADKMLLTTTRALLAAGSDVVVMFPCPGPLVALVEAAGAAVVVLPDFALRRRYLRPTTVLPLLWRGAMAVRWAVGQHRQRPFDLIFTNTQAVVIGPVLRLLLGRPHLWHVHEIVVRPAWMAKALATLAGVGSDRVVCASQSIRSWLGQQQRGVGAPAVVVLNGIDVGPMTMLPPPDLTGNLRVGCIARLHPSKGQDLLIEAIDLLRTRGVTVDLVLFGDVFPGNEWVVDDLARTVADLGLQSVVRFAGFEPRWELVYSAMDVCVVASTSPEPFSLVAVESQACARPVVAPDEGGPTEIVIDGVTGVLFEARSATSLADAIARLDADRELGRSMGAKGRTHVAAHFDIARYEREMVAECASLVPTSVPAWAG
jgi:glycosyltransferase involved in cell wall biosynthesis